MKVRRLVLPVLAVFVVFAALRPDVRSWASGFAKRLIHDTPPYSKQPTLAVSQNPPTLRKVEETRAEENDEAWQTFEKVIGGSAERDPAQEPAFVQWASKSDIGLDPVKNNPQLQSCRVYSRKKWLPHGKNTSALRLACSVSKPAQLSISQEEQRTPNTIGSVRAVIAAAPTLATVRFSPDAVNYVSDLDQKDQTGSRPWFQSLTRMAMKSNPQTPDLSTPDPKREYPIIIKTIWEVVPNPASDPFYWTCQTPETEGVRKIDDPGQCLNLDKATQGTGLYPMPSGWSKNRIATAPNGQVDEASDSGLCKSDLTLKATAPSPNPTIPGMCLFHVDMNPSMKDAMAVLQKNVAPELPAAANCYHGCDLVLVGIHTMRFIHKPGKESHWLWATFWWTPQSNHRYAGPWAHFQMKATSVGLSKDDPSTVVYNPYLEGLSDTNGAVSNCIQCHQFAGFDVNGPQNSNLSVARMPEVVQSTGSALGLPNLLQPMSCSVFDTNATDPLTCGYFTSQTIQTQRIWSLTTRLRTVLTATQSN